MPEETAGPAYSLESTDGEKLTQCTVCDASIDPSDWHPVAAGFDEAGEFHVFPFCSVACRHAWKDGKDST